MQLADFDFTLPPELIAQEPTRERSQSRLFYVDRKTKVFSHHHFADLVTLLPDSTLLVLNDTRVFPARLRGHKESGGRLEVLLIRHLSEREQTWEVLCKGGQNVHDGDAVIFTSDLWGRWKTAPREGRGVLEFVYQGDFLALVECIGEVPLPPYIKREIGSCVEDQERYQTVYARHTGAVAAPTAGLHFTPALLTILQQRGIELCFVTLHVGAGTFQPIRGEQIEAHTMEEEEYEITLAAASRLNWAKQNGMAIIAVGTTTTRALESACSPEGYIDAGRRRSALFMYPGFRFRVIDGLITNFHLPRSTLLLLVSAFAGRELTLAAYSEAIRRHYRFYSYGDAMLIV